MSKCRPPTKNVLLVSKPVEPPWNDSSKNLARDLGGQLRRYQGLVLTPKRPQMAHLGRSRAIPVYEPRRRAVFTPPFSGQWPILQLLLRERYSALWHFFFAPNIRTSTVARACAKLRKRLTVQTVCSAPADTADLGRVLFADRVVVLSQHTYRRFAAAGFEERRLSHIPPCIPWLASPPADERIATRREHGLPLTAPLLIYPGDLEFSHGADLALDCLAGLPTTLEAHLLLCCRTKTAAAAAARKRLAMRVDRQHLQGRVHFLGETPAIHRLLHAADVVVLPAEHLYAKMDLPLVLLEAMALTRPVVVLRGTAAAELAQGGGAFAVAQDADAIIATVSDLLEDTTQRHAVGQVARRQVLTKYDPAMMALAYERLYDDLLGKAS